MTTALLVVAGQHVDALLTALWAWLAAWVICAVLVGSITWAVNRRG